MAIKVTQDKTTTVLRNLEEQVLKNKQDIARHYEMDRALANLGIKVLGSLVSTDELPGLDDEIPFPAAPNYTGEFGDAYAVRTENWTADDPDYIYYVFTRANLNVGEANDYWLNVGKIGIQGEPGPRGEQGMPGIPGNAARWYSGSFIPTTAAQEGDMFLVTSAASNGDVYRYTGDQWVKQTNLRGAQGLQGDRGPRGEQGIKGDKGNPGEKGEPGRPFSIAGVLASIDYLPIPTTENRDKAYLVEIAGDETNYDIYFIVGSEESGYLWHNAGEFATVQGPQGNQGEKGDQGIPGLSIFRSTATSILNNTIPLSSITNLEGRTVQVGDLVLIKYKVHNITAINGNTLTVSQTGNDLQGPQGEQGLKGDQGSNITYYKAYFNQIYGYNYTRFWIPDSIVSNAQSIRLKGIDQYWQVDSSGYDYVQRDILVNEIVLYERDQGWSDSYRLTILKQDSPGSQPYEDSNISMAYEYTGPYYGAQHTLTIQNDAIYSGLNGILLEIHL